MLKHIQVKENSMACWVNPDGFDPDRQSLVFVHGSGSNSGVWSYQYGKLHRQFNIAVVNLPGHGGSGGKGERDIAAYANHVKDLLEVLGLTHPILIGHSMGAAVTLSFAATYRQSVAAIVLAGGSATLPVNEDILNGLITNPDAALDLICKFSLAKENRPKLFDALRSSMASGGIDMMAGDMRACNQVDLNAELAKIEVPALVICGAQDKMTPPEASKALAAKIRNARLAIIEGAGHMVMMEKPDEFNHALINFCKELNQGNLCLS